MNKVNKLIGLCEELNEAKDLTGTPMAEFAAQVGELFARAFPNSYHWVQPRKILGTFIQVEFTQGAKGKWPSGIAENDPMHTRMLINGFNDDGTFEGDKIEANLLIGGRVGSFGPGKTRTNLKWRKTKGKPSVVLKAIERHVVKMKDWADKNPLGK